MESGHRIKAMHPDCIHSDPDKGLRLCFWLPLMSFKIASCSSFINANTSGEPVARCKNSFGGDTRPGDATTSCSALRRFSQPPVDGASVWGPSHAAAEVAAACTLFARTCRLSAHDFTAAHSLTILRVKMLPVYI